MQFSSVIQIRTTILSVNVLEIFFSEIIGHNIGQQMETRKMGNGTQAEALADKD